MPDVANESIYTEEELAEIREELIRVKAETGLSWEKLGAQCDIKAGTLSNFAGGTYAGNNDKIAGNVKIWLEQRTASARVAATVPAAPGYQATQSAEEFQQTLQYAQVMPDISLIIGGPGVGKTTALKKYAAGNRNVWIATMQPCTGTVHPMLSAIAEAVGVQEKAPAKVSRAIGARVAGSGGLIGVDEAQHLVPAALDQLRALHDLYDIGIALVGNEQVISRISGGRNANNNFAQLYSRIGMRTVRATPRPKDICSLIEAWEVKNPDEVKLLKAIARKPGALRGLTKCLQLASMLAAGAGEARSIKHIKQAWERLDSAPQGS